MKEFKGTPGPWVADIRGGCAAIYPSCRYDDTPGCHCDDDRNIVFSSKGAKYNGTHWEIDGSVEHDFNLMAAAPELLEALQNMIGAFDNPIARRKLPSTFNYEAIQSARAAIKKALGEKQ